MHNAADIRSAASPNLHGMMDSGFPHLAANPLVLRGPRRPDLLRNERLPDILTSTARKRPRHPALIWGDRVVTYAELNETSSILGSALARRGAAARKTVGLLMPRGADVLIAQAGISKSGAAWLPFDAKAPFARVRSCLQAANAIGLLTCRAWLPQLADGTVPTWAAEELWAEEAPACPGTQAEPSDPAYVLFTSGSTGQPKGVMISHRSICHFLRSENELLRVGENDRVYQGFSIAFDMSFEEIWISYLAGATLWIASPSLVGDPDLLAATLTRERLTVLHAVPTLMSLIRDPLPTVRLINLGGEACPDELVRRFAGPGRRLFNSYGPAEASVSASLAELKPDNPVTIGAPLPNYGMMVVDPHGQPLPAGEPGELAIFGPGVALGYLGQPLLTAEKFIPNPLAAGPDEARMYLTGDRACMDPGGPVYFLGRADSQVKIRGFRVELDEIAATLKAQPGVAAAAAVMRPLAEMDQIVGFLVAASNRNLDLAALRREVSSRLPPYMIPAHFELLDELPRLISGKIDYETLRTIPLKSAEPQAADSIKARNEDEEILFSALGKLFPGRAFDRNSDFFDDLGGHSLLAARLVSLLRGDSRYVALSVRDVYRERRIDGIARAMTHLRLQKPNATAPVAHPAPAIKRWICGAAQALVVPFFILLRIADWLAPFFVYHYFTGDEGDSIPLAISYALIAFMLAQLTKFLLAIAGKRLLAGPLSPGRYPLWGLTYFRWWLTDKFAELPDTYLLSATPWMPLYLRALGARVGRDVMIDTLTLAVPELLTIQDGVSIGSFVNIENARVERGALVLGPVLLKQESVVDSYSVLENDTQLGCGARLCGQSALAAGRAIPDHEIWEGSPARPTDRVDEALPPRPHITRVRQGAQAMLFAATAGFVSVLFFLPTFPAFMLIDWLDTRTWDVFESTLGPGAVFGLFFLLSIPASALFVLLTMSITAGLTRLLPRQTAGISSVHSFAFWRHRFVTLILENSLHVLHGLYASVFAPAWLRLLGVRVGNHAEVSTAEGMVPELLSLGDDSFIADGAMLGDEEVRGGWMILKPTRIGNRSFVGNGAYISDGTMVPDDVLIGVQTRAPKNEQLRSGQTWMGSPPLLLPARECLKGFPASLTFRPSPLRWWGRATIEGLRIVLPLSAIIAAGYLIVRLVIPLAAENGWSMKAVNSLAGAGCLYALASFVSVVALKWLLVGRYRPRAAPMWTPFVWISEAVTNLYESLAVPVFLDLLRATPMLPGALRLIGARIGKGVYLNTTDLTEFDCVHIGDESELNAWCGPQTHLFEDRIMKIGMVEIGARVTVGARSTILYGARVGDRAQLGPLTLVAKGEHLPASTGWEGTPAVPLLQK